MDLKNVKKVIALAKDEGLQELVIEQGDTKIKVSLPVAGAPMAMPIATTAAPAPVSSGRTQAAEVDNASYVTSPFVGTFYGSPSPDDPPFVSVGQKVRKGQVLCILEAMKIMNELESDIDGEIVEVLVENEALVEFGQKLFKIKK